MATPSLAMIPSAYADSKVYSVLPNNGDGDFTFNRDSSATRVGQNGLIQTVGFFGNELVTNGDFTTDSDWTKGTGWTISGGKANYDGVASISNFSQVITSFSGKTFLVEGSASNVSQGFVYISLGGTDLQITVNSNGSFKHYVTISSGNSTLFISARNNFIGSIDNISVKEVTGDQPRLNYDISNGVVQSCPSLLLEPASTNLVPYSENFNSGWTQYGSPTINTSSVISPDGTLNGSNITRGSNATPLRYQSLTSTGTQYTFSLYAKKGSVDKIYLDIGDVAEVEFTLTDEWQRFEITQTPPTFTHIDISFGTSISGDNFYIFGAQLEALSYATSYIPTNGSSQTRAAETCFGAGTASTFNDSEGVLYAEISALADDGTNRQIAISNGTTSKRNYIGYRIATNQVIGGSVNTSEVFLNHTLSNSTENIKIAFKYKQNDLALWVNGVEVDTSSSVNLPSGLDRLNFDDGSGGTDFYGNCKDLRVYNEALTDAQLQTLTTL